MIEWISPAGLVFEFEDEEFARSVIEAITAELVPDEPLKPSASPLVMDACGALRVCHA